MPLELARLYSLVPVGMLVIFRMAGLMIAAPMFGSTVIPLRVRIGLAVAFGLVLLPVVGPLLPRSLTLGSAVAGLAGEFVLGLLLGLAVDVVFAGIQIAGLMVGQQAGIALAQTFNPAFESQTSILGQLYFFVALMVFLAVGGHRALMRGLIESFRTVPVMSFVADESAMHLLAGLLQSSLILAVRLAGPTLIALFLASVALNFVARTVPQLNILVVGFPLRVTVALLISAAALYGMQELFCDALDELFEGLRALLGVA